MKRIYLLHIALLLVLFSAGQTDSLKYKQIPDSAGVYSFVETNPVFPGGDKALMAFLGKNITYPKYERNHDIQGKVLLRFVLDEDGSVTNVRVIKSVSPGLDAVAVKVVKMLPKFVPAKQHGKPVKVYFNLPVVFRLQ